MIGESKRARETCFYVTGLGHGPDKSGELLREG
jgi:hypothetical protein